MNFNFTLIKIVLFSIGLALSVHRLIKGIKTKNIKIIDVFATILFAAMLYWNARNLDL